MNVQLWVDQICVVGVDAMINIDGQIRNLLKASSSLINKAFSSESVTDADKEIITDHLLLLSEQLGFWALRKNKQRFYYDLKDHIRWMLKKYP